MKINPPISGLGIAMILAHLSIGGKEVYAKPTHIVNGDILPEDMVRWGRQKQKRKK
jgi:hypothetical protein